MSNERTTGPVDVFIRAQIGAGRFPEHVKEFLPVGIIGRDATQVRCMTEKCDLVCRRSFVFDPAEFIDMVKVRRYLTNKCSK
jgi:hypothetical protein